MKMQVGFRLEEEIIAKIDEIAASERRNRTSMVEILLIEAIQPRAPKWKPPEPSA